MERVQNKQGDNPREADLCLPESPLDPSHPPQCPQGLLPGKRSFPRSALWGAAGNLSVWSVHLCAGFKHEKGVVELRVEGGIQAKRGRAQPQN